MKTFQIVTLFALIAASMAFSPNQLPQGEYSTLRCLPALPLTTFARDNCRQQGSSRYRSSVEFEEWEWFYSVAVNWRPRGRPWAFGHALVLKYA